MKLLLENWRGFLNESQDLMSKLLKMPVEQAVAIIGSIDTSGNNVLLYDYSDAMEKEFNKSIGTPEEAHWRHKKDAVFDAIEGM